MDYKKKYSLLLNNLTVQKSFSVIASRCKNNVNAENEEEGYCVDAKSILGFFSLDLNRPVTITVNNEEDAVLIEKELKKKSIVYSVVA